MIISNKHKQIIMDIFLNKQKSKVSNNTNSFVPIRLTNGAKLLPTDSLVTTINEVELYNQERKASNIVRLTCTINPICSNVLHNTITEIVKNEGSDECFCLNFTPLSGCASCDANKLLYKTKSSFTDAFSGVRDTQLSNEANGFQYHCGTDIFNNHILRSLTFKTVCGYGGKGNSGKHDEFNTLEDTMRSIDGKNISGYKDYIEEDRKSTNGKPSIKKLHLYLKEEVLSFEECVENRLIEENGWYGFINIGKFPTIDDNNEQLDIYKVINNRKPCDFIDMYPSRDLWYFTPKYNKHRKRIEKNWDYCLTYPSSSTTNVDFIRSGTTSLKVCMFDDTLSNSIGTSGLKLYSVSKHGLSKGDIINVYDGDDIIIRNTSVVDIEDDYTFSVYDQGVDISNLWYQLSNNDLMSGVTSGVTISGITYEFDDFNKFLVYEDESGKTIKYPILPNKKVCLEQKDISYKKVVEGEELEYYVRIFSKIPNWKFADKEPTEYEMYKENSDLISRCQSYENDFESHVSRLAFSKNIYGDDISEIVFSDNIDLSNLKDNLGRPLSEIYLTIIKNNIGYKLWYEGHECGSPYVEFSHCFGKLNCAFKLSSHAVPFNEYVNVTTINSLESSNFSKKGLDIDKINENGQSFYPIGNSVNDEIQYRSKKNLTNVYEIHNGKERLYQTFSNGDIEGNKHFYGDLCCYSTKLLDEQSIQMINFRFNTAQRELSSNITRPQLTPPSQSQDGDEPQPMSTEDTPFKNIRYDEIVTDDYDLNNFKCDKKNIINENRLEGYCYVPHHKIQIHTFDDEIKTDKPNYVPIKNYNINDGDGTISCITRNYHYFNKNDVVYFSTFDGDCFQYQVTDIENSKMFVCEPLDFGHQVNSKNKIHRLFKSCDDTPSYATLSNDGSAHFSWREFIKNGFDTENKVEQYPFMNNALYVNKNINLFVQRQDPDDVGHIRHVSSFPTDAEINKLTNIKENNYYQEEDIKC